MSNCIIPHNLKSGDKVIMISPSGNIDPILIDESKKILESWGLLVVVAKHAKNKLGRFCGTVEERLSDLQLAMDDPEVKMIFCSRGGYGIVHLLSYLNFDGIKKYPKWIVGYSDITALHLTLMQNNIASLHAPMSRHLVEESSDDTATTYLRKLLFDGIQNYQISSHDLNIEGFVKGLLWGGNLAVLVGLIGSQYLNPPQKGILFLEDIGESPYKIDRMMWQLKLSGILSQCQGLIIGQFTDCNEDPLMYKTIYESIKEMVSEYNYPVVFNFPVGHVKENYPLIYSSEVLLDVNSEFVILKNLY